MLRLQNSLNGKALKLVKDLGFTISAYKRAKEMFDKKHGSDRWVQMYRLHPLCKIFKKNLNRKIHYDSVKEHPKVSKITKFGCEML